MGQPKMKKKKKKKRHTHRKLNTVRKLKCTDLQKDYNEYVYIYIYRERERESSGRIITKIFSVVTTM